MAGARSGRPAWRGRPCWTDVDVGVGGRSSASAGIVVDGVDRTWTGRGQETGVDRKQGMDIGRISGRIAVVGEEAWWGERQEKEGRERRKREEGEKKKRRRRQYIIY